VEHEQHSSPAAVAWRSGCQGQDPELQPHEIAALVLIVGMGRVGRTLADALTEFDIGYSALEHDQRRLSEAVADGYSVVFGDIWGTPESRIQWRPIDARSAR